MGRIGNLIVSVPDYCLSFRFSMVKIILQFAKPSLVCHWKGMTTWFLLLYKMGIPISLWQWKIGELIDLNTNLSTNY